MRNLAEYVLKSRKNAILVALLFTIVPFFSWVSDAIMALVTLRKGAKEGAIVLLWVVLPYIVLAVLKYPMLWTYDILGGSCIVFLTAVILRYTNSWMNVLQCLMLLGISVVLIVHIFMPDILLQVAKNVSTYFNILNERFKLALSPATLQNTTQVVTKFALGAQITLLFLGDLFNLVMARWAQSLLFNVGGLRNELLTLRLNLLPIILLILAIVLTLLGSTTTIDCLPLIIFPFILTGLSIIHYLIDITQKSKFWLFGTYLFLVLFFVYIGTLLASIAITDYWMDLRSRFQKRAS